MSEITPKICSAFRQALTTAANERRASLENQVCNGKRWAEICADAEHFLCVIEANSDEDEEE